MATALLKLSELRINKSLFLAKLLTQGYFQLPAELLKARRALLKQALA